MTAPPTDDEREATPTIDLAREIASFDQGAENTNRIPHWAVNLAMHLHEEGFRRQGPITDAQVEAAAESLWEHDAVDEIRLARTRAALEAAREADR